MKGLQLWWTCFMGPQLRERAVWFCSHNPLTLHIAAKCAEAAAELTARIWNIRGNEQKSVIQEIRGKILRNTDVDLKAAEAKLQSPLTFSCSIRWTSHIQNQKHLSSAIIWLMRLPSFKLSYRRWFFFSDLLRGFEEACRTLSGSFCRNNEGFLTVSSIPAAVSRTESFQRTTKWFIWRMQSFQTSLICGSRWGSSELKGMWGELPGQLKGHDNHEQKPNLPKVSTSHWKQRWPTVL